MDLGDAGTMRNHWWWRQGWHVGRSSYTWHFTFADTPAVHELASAHADLLAELPMLDPVPVPWLHMTTQGVGFTDEVSTDDLARMVEAARVRCAALAPFTATFGPAVMDSEGVYLPVRPLDRFAQVRCCVRAAIADVWSVERVPEASDEYHPHVTLGYSNADGPARPLRAALNSRELPSTEAVIESVSLLRLDRDNRMYQWTIVAEVQLGDVRRART